MLLLLENVGLRSEDHQQQSQCRNCADIHAWIEAMERLRDAATREIIAQKAYDDFIRSYTWKNTLKYGMDYVDKGADYYETQYRDRVSVRMTLSIRQKN